MKTKFNFNNIRKSSEIFKEAQVVMVGMALGMEVWCGSEWKSTISSQMQRTVTLLAAMATTVILVLLHITLRVNTVTMCLTEMILNTSMSFFVLFIGVVPVHHWTADEQLKSSEIIFAAACILASFVYLSDAAVAINDMCMIEERFKKEKKLLTRTRKIMVVPSEELKQWWQRQEELRAKMDVTERKVDGEKEDKMSEIQEEDEMDGKVNKEIGMEAKDEDVDKNVEAKDTLLKRNRNSHAVSDDKDDTKKDV